MKKVLKTALGFVLVIALALAAGCGNTGSSSSGSTSSTSSASSSASSGTSSTDIDKTLTWPDSAFPPGFPEYPGGVVSFVEIQDDSFYVEVTETDRATYDIYKKTLASAGWVFQDYDFGMGADIAFKDGMLLIMLMSGTTVGISLDNEGGQTYVDWPAGAFPTGFPVYPNGRFTNFIQDETKTILYIEKSTKDDFDNFVKALKAAGWNENPHDSVTSNEVYTYTARNDEYFVSVSWSSLSANIYVSKIDLSGSDFQKGTGWPASLDTSIRQYPDGSISYVTYVVNGSYNITITNTSEQTYKSYAEAMIKDGWEALMPLDYAIDGSLWNMLYNDDFNIIIKLEDSKSVSISVSKAIGTSTSEWVAGWPKSLPVSLPVYPDGDIEHFERSGGKSMAIIVEHTSQASYDKYIDNLLADGWALSGTRGATDNKLSKGKSTIGLVLKVHEGNTWIHIDLTF